jgi:hypothetical protein
MHAKSRFCSLPHRNGANLACRSWGGARRCVRNATNHSVIPAQAGIQGVDLLNRHELNMNPVRPELVEGLWQACFDKLSTNGRANEPFRINNFSQPMPWIPACAGMTVLSAWILQRKHQIHA